MPGRSGVSPNCGWASAGPVNVSNEPHTRSTHSTGIAARPLRGGGRGVRGGGARDGRRATGPEQHGTEHGGERQAAGTGRGGHEPLRGHWTGHWVVCPAPSLGAGAGATARRAGTATAPARGGRAAVVESASCRQLTGSTAGVSAIAVVRRLVTTTAATMIATATAAMVSRTAGLAPDADRQRDDGRGDQHRDQVHHLDQRVDRRAGGVLERVADGVADDGGLVRRRALAAVVAVLDELLAVVPRAAGVGQEDRHQGAGRRWRRPGSRPAGRRRGRSRPRSGRRSPAGRGWPARAASRGCRCRRRGRTPDAPCRP